MSDTNTMLRYFWQQKGDLTRWTGWSQAPDIPPVVTKAWADYLVARQILDAVIASLPVEDDE